MKTLRAVDLISAVALAWGAASALPLSAFWFRPGETLVADSFVGKPIYIAFEREILRPVTMSYQVTVRTIPDLRVVCDPASQPFTYRPEAKLPDPIRMKWWANDDPRCRELESGSYVMQTCWTANNRWWVLLPRTICRNSNVFNVWEHEPLGYLDDDR